MAVPRFPASANVPERARVAPMRIEVSLTPSVSDQSEGHLVRSTVQPSGPVRVLPSADFPHLLSLIRLTMAARSLAHSASHSASDVGSGPLVVEVVGPVVGEVEEPAPGAVVAADPSLPSSPPQAAATSSELSSADVTT